MNRIIIVGPAATGKDFLKKRLGEKGMILDVSYTTRPPRDGEEEGKHYNFVSEEEWKDLDMYEHVDHGKYKYGTGQWEWDNCDVFIMETDGVEQIDPKERGDCLVIYLDSPEHERIRRMRLERKWEYPEIQERLEIDKMKFEKFSDFDIRITNPDF